VRSATACTRSARLQRNAPGARGRARSNSSGSGYRLDIRSSLALLLLLAVLPTTADASIWVTNGARSPTLRVDARGNAEVRWRDARGRMQTLLIPRQGKVLPGGHIVGRDVSRREATSTVPLAVAVRRTRDGRLWALQRWQVMPRGPVELRFARWTDEPTLLSAEVEDGRLVGTATYHGRPLFGSWPTTAGKRVRVVAYVDAQAGSSWRRLLGVFPRSPDGSFSVLLRSEWAAPAYRVTLRAPNLGWAYTPDARVVVTNP
jgi:hypothetical protein